MSGTGAAEVELYIVRRGIFYNEAADMLLKPWVKTIGVIVGNMLEVCSQDLALVAKIIDACGNTVNLNASGIYDAC